MTASTATQRARAFLLLCGSLLAMQSTALPAQSSSGPPGAAEQDRAQERDGQHDFDFEIGTWTTRLRRLERPLSGSTSWVEYEGTSVVRKVWDGRANLVELDVEGPSGRIVGLNLRLYNPESRQWSLHFASARNGMLVPPVIGEFTDGRGEFYGQEMFDGRLIFVRFIITVLGTDSARFEQAFSDDGGQTWEENWVAIDTRVKEGSGDDR